MKKEKSELELKLSDLDPNQFILNGGNLYNNEGIYPLSDLECHEVDIERIRGRFLDDVFYSYIKPKNKNYFIKFIDNKAIKYVPLFDKEATSLCYNPKTDIFFMGDKEGIIKIINGDNGKEIKKWKVADAKITAIACSSNRLYAGTEHGQIFMTDFNETLLKEIDSPLDQFNPRLYDWGQDNQIKSKIKKIRIAKEGLFFLSKSLYFSDFNLDIKREIYFSESHDFEIIDSYIAVSWGARYSSLSLLSITDFCNGKYAGPTPSKNGYAKPLTLKEDTYGENICHTIEKFFAKGDPFIRTLWKRSYGNCINFCNLGKKGFPEIRASEHYKGKIITKD